MVTAPRGTIYDAKGNRLAVSADVHNIVISPKDIVEGEKAAAKRAEAAQAKTTQTESGYTVTGEGDPAIDALVLARYEAKKAKNFAEADRIRDELKAQGIEIIDTKGGASWKRV